MVQGPTKNAMLIHCKACGTTFKPDEYNCEEDLLCPLIQIEIITHPKKNESPINHNDEQPGPGNPAPSDSPNCIEI
jgi:hypothetical protein